MAATISPLSDDIGVAVPGLSSAAFVDVGTAEQCLTLLHTRGVVVYPEAHVTNSDLVAFSRMLGTVADPGAHVHPGFPEIARVTLDPAMNKLAGLRRSSVHWHADGFTTSVPQKASLLSARAVADVGGETEFASTYAAYEALPESKKDELDHYRVVHSVAASLSVTHTDPTEAERRCREQLPTREHPLVWRRRDGRRSMLIGATAESISHMSHDASRSLLDGLLAWSTKKCFVMRHHWRVGDLVVWDNTGVPHRTIPYDCTSKRSMHRTFIAGDEAVH